MTKMVFVIFTLLLSACTFYEEKKSVDSTESQIQFSPEVRAIITGVCINCHNGFGANGLIAFMNDPNRLVSEVSPTQNSWRYVVAGDPDNSLLYRKVLEMPPFGDRMPYLEDPLSALQIQALRDWILSLENQDRDDL